MIMDVPRDKNYPSDAVQCDPCGGTGKDFAYATNPDCSCCEGKGWLPQGHLRGRRCSNLNCNKFLPPDHIPVYCSNNCAFDDA